MQQGDLCFFLNCPIISEQTKKNQKKQNKKKKNKKKKNAILARNTESKQWILKKKGVISTLKQFYDTVNLNDKLVFTINFVSKIPI